MLSLFFPCDSGGSDTKDGLERDQAAAEDSKCKSWPRPRPLSGRHSILRRPEDSKDCLSHVGFTLFGQRDDDAAVGSKIKQR